MLNQALGAKLVEADLGTAPPLPSLPTDESGCVTLEWINFSTESKAIQDWD
jgi:hypothetical protein